MGTYECEKCANFFEVSNNNELICPLCGAESEFITLVEPALKNKREGLDENQVKDLICGKTSVCRDCCG